MADMDNGSAVMPTNSAKKRKQTSSKMGKSDYAQVDSQPLIIKNHDLYSNLDD